MIVLVGSVRPTWVYQLMLQCRCVTQRPIGLLCVLAPVLSIISATEAICTKDPIMIGGGGLQNKQTKSVWTAIGHYYFHAYFFSFQLFPYHLRRTLVSVNSTNNDHDHDHD